MLGGSAFAKSGSSRSKTPKKRERGFHNEKSLTCEDLPIPYKMSTHCGAIVIQEHPLGDTSSNRGPTWGPEMQKKSNLKNHVGESGCIEQLIKAREKNCEEKLRSEKLYIRAHTHKPRI